MSGFAGCGGIFLWRWFEKKFFTDGIELAVYVLNSMRLMGLVEIGLFEVVPINQRLMGYCRIKNFEEKLEEK